MTAAGFVSWLMWVGGFAGVGSAALYGLSYLKWGAKILGWISGRTIPWRWIVIGLAAFAITAVVFAAHSFVDGMRRDLAQKTADLAIEKMERDLAVAREQYVTNVHNEMVLKMRDLEAARSEIAAEASLLRNQLSTLEEEMKREPEKAASALANRSRALNRMLERRSQGHR